jgi:hypothetical protein
MGGRERTSKIDEMGNNLAKAKEILRIQAQSLRRDKVVHNAAKVRRSKVKPHVIPGEELSERLENLWVEEAGDKGPEERLLLPDLPQRVLPKRTRDADPVGKMDDVTLKRDSPAPTFLPGNMTVTDDLCKRCKRRKILKEQIGHEGMVVRIVEFKVEGIKTLPQRECPNVMQKTPKEEIPKGPF